MKKLLLLLAGGLLVNAANGQQVQRTIIRNDKPIAAPHTFKKAGSAARTTSTGITSGWFNYVDSVLTPNIANFGLGGSEGISTMYFWPDTTAIFGYDNSGTTGAIGYGIPSFGYSYNVSTGLLFDPFASDWQTNTSTLPNITTTTPYIIDSVLVAGTYGRPLGATYTDHLSVSLVYGTLSSGSDITLSYFNDATLLSWYNLASPDSALWSPNLYYDSTNNQAAQNGTGVAPYTYTLPLTATDTSEANIGSYVIPVNVPVPAGNVAAASVSFKTGSTYPALGDSIQGVNGTNYYGNFSPIVAFSQNATSGTVLFPPYMGPEPGTTLTGDYTTGYFKTVGATDQGWTGSYVPQWALSSGSAAGGGYYQQTPYIWFHVSCPTCTALATPEVKSTISEVKAYPNPAVESVTISFKMATANDVTVTLNNVVGQTVASQTISNTANGTATFNTASLPAGVYIYTLTSNGTRSVGQIVVAH